MLKVLRAKLGQLASMRAFGYTVLIVVVFFVFFWRISSFTAGLSPSETVARASSSSLHLIYNNPINASHKLLQYSLLKPAPQNIASLKLASVLFACLFVFCFYKLASSWFGRLIGLFGSLIFITMPLFIISAHQASSQVMFFAPIVLMWLYVWLNKTKQRKSLAWLVLLLSAAVFVYTPGLIWFIGLGAIICRKKITTAVADIKPRLKAVGIFIALGLITPLLVSSIYHPQIIRKLLLIPSQWVGLVAIAKDTGWTILALFVKTPTQNPLIVGRLPIFSIVVLALIVFGVYAMQAAARAKAIALGLSVLLAVVVATVNKDIVYLALGLPAICLLASAGLRYLYIEWRAIFPRNPVPKTFALILIAALTLTQVFFGIKYSLIAWPHSVATRSSYVLK